MNPFGADIFVIAITGILLAWVSYASTAQLSSSALWNTIIGIAAFVLLYGVANWTYFLSQSEKNGISDTFGATARRLLGRTANAQG